MYCSICIPCFKRLDQVRNTLRSLFEDNSDVSTEDYEVVITDNDPEHELRTVIAEFSSFSNLRYIPTECEGFMNSYHALKNGRGELLKLHNSQNRIRKGMLAVIVEQARENRHERPLIFHSNGFLGMHGVKAYSDFNSFMNSLSYWSSWSGGMTIWKEDFDRADGVEINPLFPHTSVFMTQYWKESFIIDDRIMYDVQRVAKRGGHNKFEAFTVHYPSLLTESFNAGHISRSCLDSILRSLCNEYIPTLLFNKYLARIETFDASGFKENCRRFLPPHAYCIAWMNVPMVPFRMVMRRLRQRTR